MLAVGAEVDDAIQAVDSRPRATIHNHEALIAASGSVRHMLAIVAKYGCLWQDRVIRRSGVAIDDRKPLISITDYICQPFTIGTESQGIFSDPFVYRFLLAIQNHKLLAVF